MRRSRRGFLDAAPVVQLASIRLWPRVYEFTT
jgi:hypothetical protein